MLCFFVANVMSVQIYFNFSEKVYHTGKFDTFYKHDKYNIIYDTFYKQGYMLVSEELKKSIEDIYRDLDNKEFIKREIEKKDSKDRYMDYAKAGGKIPIYVQNTRRLVAHALKYMGMRYEEDRYSKICKMIKVLKILATGPGEETERLLVRNPEKRILTINVDSNYLGNALNEMRKYGQVCKYNILSDAFVDSIENFYMHIYNEYGDLALEENDCWSNVLPQPCDIEKYLNPRLHTILSVMGATNKVIRVTNDKETQYYFMLASYEDVFLPKNNMTIKEKINSSVYSETASTSGCQIM